jgi:alkylhydroperoxidase family enzyme
VTVAPAQVSAADIEVLRTEGWSDPAIHDALQVIAYFNYVNRIADVVGIDDEPDWDPAGLDSATEEPPTGR